MSDDIEQSISEQSRFSAGNADGCQLLRSGINQRHIFYEITIEVVSLQWRLATHYATVVALRRYEQSIVIGMYVYSISHYPRVPVIQLLKIGSNSSPRSSSNPKICSMMALCLRQKEEVGLNPYISPCVE